MHSEVLGSLGLRGLSRYRVVALSHCSPVTVAVADALLLTAVVRWRWKVGASICLRRSDGDAVF